MEIGSLKFHFLSGNEIRFPREKKLKKSHLKMEIVKTKGLPDKYLWKDQKTKLIDWFRNSNDFRNRETSKEFFIEPARFTRED